MFIGVGNPIPRIANLPGASRPGSGGGGGGGGGLAQIDNLYSYEFDGTATYFDTGQIDITGTKSVSFWIYPTASGNDGGIFTMVPSGGTSDFLSVALWQSNIQAITQNGVKQRSLQTISINTWYHVVVVKATNSITNIYIDGVDQTLDNGGTWNGTKIGEATFGVTDYNFTGNIDEVGIFNVALTASEVQSIYDATTTGKTGDLNALSTPPTAWYRMGD